ncbi:MAG TPA: serpin family protein [Clostridia bacterium]|nr:serpin family protein [Clostridia bacterium]
MNRYMCILLCAVVVMGVLIGCSSNPLANPSRVGGIKDSGEPDIQDTNLVYDSEKISMDMIEGTTEFAFDIFRQLNREDMDGNIFISPLSISTVLSMTYQGAGGETQESMAGVLGYSDIDINILNESYKNLLRLLMDQEKGVRLNIGNSIWIREGKPIEGDFLAVNKDIFKARIETLDFSNDRSAEKINKWVSHATDGKIEKIIEPPIAPETIMYLINAVYFKGDWTDKFDKNKTFESKFYAGDGSPRDTMMMTREGLIQYGQGEDYTAVRLPYGNETMAMYCVLPKGESPINDFVEGLNSEKWRAIRESTAEMDGVMLNLPRFKMEYGIKSLKESLTALGMGNAFTYDANLSGIGQELFISDVLHRAVVEVNEEGSEAAAVTAVDLKEEAAAQPHEFIADRPFFFAIIDDKTGLILFMGKVYDLS